MLKILHINNIAGVANSLANWQRKLGYRAFVVTFHDKNIPMTPFIDSLRGDYQITVGGSSLLKRIVIALKLLRYVLPANVIHIHFPVFKELNIAIPFLICFRKKIIIHYHGSDIRNKEPLWAIKKFCKNIFVSTPDLLSFAPNGAKYLPNPYTIEMHDVLTKNINSNSEIVILHAPSNYDIKGTKYVIKAIDELKDEGYKLRLVCLHGVSHEEVINQIKSADIVIDQLILGYYGVFTLEAMEYSKPVVVYIADDLCTSEINDAIINVNPINIKIKLKQIIDNPDILIRKGVVGREYLEKTHNIDKIGREIFSTIGIKR